MKKNPAISVITCLYNTPPYLFEKCIKGLLKQTFKDFEVLIVNDGSTKNLEENKAIIEKYCKDDSRFNYYDKEHSGKSQTLNFALKIAKGKYIAINDSDDVSYPERLNYQYSFLELHSEYDVISNAMKANPSNIIFPGIFDSEAVTAGNLHYKANHPSQMFNREHVLNAVPFLFEQIYDSMEDNVFNHIMFHCGHLKMWYDNEILVEYSQLNPDAVHYENLYGYKKEGAFKLFYHTFNAEEFHKDAKFTCILLINKNWKEEIERTLLNIRFTSDCVKIILVVYDGTQINKNDELNKYDVKIYNANNLADAINVGIDKCETEYLMVISKPIRFYIHNWDMYAVRKLKNSDKYKFVQPYITGIDKINRDDYYNDNGKFESDYKLRTGNNLILMDFNMTEKRDSIVQYSEYTDLVNIPIIDDDLVFITSVSEMLKIQGATGWNNNILLNVFLSLKEYATDKGWIWIDMDLKCGVIDNFEFNDYEDEDDYNIDYLINIWKIAHFFLNETRFIYEKIIYDFISKTYNIDLSNFDNIGNEIMESVIKDETFNLCKKNFIFEKDMSYFLKNINLKYRAWDLTYQI